MTEQRLSEVETAEEAWTAVDVRNSIRQQAHILQLALTVTPSRVSDALDAVDLSRTSRVVLAGCGDSYYAALAAKLAFERWTSVPTDALPSMELSPYGMSTVGPQTLVACLSNSGRVSRTIEAARLARAAGATVLGVTGRTESDLAASSSVVLSQRVDTPDLPLGAGSLGLANYLVTLLSLYELALQSAERRGALDGPAVADLRARIAEAPALIEATFDVCDEPAQALADAVSTEPVLYMLGAGPSLATVYFGCAKLYEQPQFDGVPQELEEFAHEQYFMVVEGTPVLFVTPPGQSRVRSLELFRAAAGRGATVAAVGSSDDAELRAGAAYWLPVSGELPEELSPLLYVVPLELFADSMAKAPRPPRRPRRQLSAEEAEAFEYQRIYGSAQDVADA